MDYSSVAETISYTINSIFNKFFSSVDNSLYSILDDFTFINSNILNDSYFSDIFGLQSSEGILLIANSLVSGYLLYYAFKLLFAHLGVTEVERPTKFLFKIILCTIFMNFSLFICDEIIYFISILSNTIRQIGENLFHTSICFSSLIEKLNTTISINSNSLDIFSVDGLIKSIISIGMLNLVITYSIRYVLIKVFVIISPFCFLSLSNKGTSILFTSWMKSFLSLLLVQVFVSIILLLVFSLNMSSNKLFYKFILVGAIFILIKANDYVREMLGGITTNANLNINNINSLFKK